MCVAAQCAVRHRCHKSDEFDWFARGLSLLLVQVGDVSNFTTKHRTAILVVLSSDAFGSERNQLHLNLEICSTVPRASVPPDQRSL